MSTDTSDVDMEYEGGYGSSDSSESASAASRKTKRLENRDDSARHKRHKVPFSPRYAEANRQRNRDASGSGSMSPKPSTSKAVSILDSGRSVRNRTRPSFRRHRERDPLDLVRSSQSAMKNVSRLMAVTRNIEEMHSRKRKFNASGVIKRITLYNFMCHKTFTQEWHENLNFIIGENGSGKSALLSGLMIGLGGKALSTSRTSSVKDLIKTGETHAKIEIVLLNKGKLPIETYGEEICVQRVINHSGQSTYKLQFGSGSKFKPATKVELDHILRSLDIQLDNPVVILNQEYARSFLRSKDPKDKYKLFEDGTGTGECDRLRFQVSQTLEEIKATLSGKQEELDTLKKTYKDCEERVKLVEGIASHRQDLNKLELELKWYYVQLEEKKEQELQQEMAKLTTAKDKAEQSYQDSLGEIRRIESENGPSEAEIIEHTHKKQECEKRRIAIKDESHQLMKKKVNYEMKLKTAEAQIPKKRKTVETLENKVATTEQKIKEDREVLMRQYQEQKDRLKESIDELQVEIRNCDEEKNRFSDGAIDLRRQIDSVKSRRDGTQGQIEKKERELRLLKTNTSGLAAFGPQMETLVGKIKANASKFSQPPRGPLGACVTVKDHKYAQIIQFILRGVLFDFVVNDGKDMSLLTSLIDEVYGRNNRGRRPSVTTMKFQSAYDHSRTNCSRGLEYPTILDQLVFENNDHIVMNALLDVQSIERILLFKDAEEALSLLEDQPKVPKGTKHGYTLDFYRITPVPNLRCDAQAPPRNSTTLIRSSQKAQIRNLEFELATLNEEIQNFVVDPELVEEERRMRQQEKRCDDVRRQKRSEWTNLKQKLENLKEPPNRTADLASVKEELEELKEEILRLEEEIEPLRVTVRETLDAIKKKNVEIKETDEEIANIQKRINHFRELRYTVNDRVREAQQFAERFKRTLDKTKEEMNICHRKILCATEKVKQVTEIAAACGDRVPLIRASAAIKKEHDEIKARIEHLEKFEDRNDSIRERYEAVKKRYTKYHNDMRMVTKMFGKVEKYFNKVNLHYLLARDRVTNALMQCYEEIAKARKYFGKIKIDHKTKELFYLICPDKESLEKITRHESDASDAKFRNKMIEYAAGLSGGERSFSTICFIISMWQAMKSPFYMLDEFDVFMDAQNRIVSQEALMNHAKAFPNNQFFFFTPLDLANIPSKSEALILRLYPPARKSVAQDLPIIETEDISQHNSRKRYRDDDGANVHNKVPRR